MAYSWAIEYKYPSLSYIVIIFIISLIVFGIHLILSQIYYNTRDYNNINLQENSETFSKIEIANVEQELQQLISR